MHFHRNLCEWMKCDHINEIWYEIFNKNYLYYEWIKLWYEQILPHMQLVIWIKLDDGFLMFFCPTLFIKLTTQMHLTMWVKWITRMTLATWINWKNNSFTKDHKDRIDDTLNHMTSINLCSMKSNIQMKVYFVKITT
jgi:hypothetical protein